MCISPLACNAVHVLFAKRGTSQKSHTHTLERLYQRKTMNGFANQLNQSPYSRHGFQRSSNESMYGNR